MQRHLRVLGARLHGRGRGRATLRAMAEYHEAFWVAIAGAAPVIGLAHVLTLPPLLREAVKARDEGHLGRARAVRWAYYVSAGGVALCVALTATPSVLLRRPRTRSGT